MSANFVLATCYLLPKQVLARKIAYNVAFSSIAKIFSTILALVGIGFITRYLGREGFGDYATVLAFFSFFAAIADLGLYSVATREISRKNADEAKIMGNVFVLRIISSLFVLLLAPLTIIFLPYSHEIKTGILIIALSFVFSSSYMVLNGIFQKNLAIDRVVLAELFGKIIQITTIITAIKFDLGFIAIMSALLFSMMFNFIVILILSRRYLKFKLEMDLSYWRKFLKNSLPMGLSVIITFFYFKIDTILLSFMQGSEAVGIYNAAYKIMENIIFFPAMIMGLVLPIISRHIFSDSIKFKNIANKTFKVFFLLIIPLLIGIMFLAEDIMLIVGGQDFLISANVLRFLSVALVFIFFGNFFNSILLAGNLQKKLMKVLAICAVVNISLNFALIPTYSYLGASFVSALTELLVVILTFYLTVRFLNYKPQLENIFKFLLSGGAMIIFLIAFNNHNFFLLLFGSSAVYFTFLWLTKAVKMEEIRSIFARQ